MLATTMPNKADDLNEIILPKQMTKWLNNKIHTLALESSKVPIEAVLREVSAIVMGKLKSIIKSAGKDAEKWAKKRATTSCWSH